MGRGSMLGGGGWEDNNKVEVVHLGIRKIFPHNFESHNSKTCRLWLHKFIF